MSQDSLSSLLPKFIASLKQKNRSPSTILAYNSDVKQLIDYLAKLGKALPTDIRSSDIEGFRDYLLTQKYNPKSTSRKLNAVKTFFRWLKEKKIIINDPAKDVGHPKIESSRPKFLSQIEYRALRDVVRNDVRIAAIIELILQTGMRISEVANIKLKYLKKDNITIEAYATQPQRTVQLNQRARLAVEEYLKIRPNYTSEYVFISKTGKPLAIRNIRAAIDRYLQRAEIGTYSVNDIRTTFIVENLKRGVDLVTISQAVGHKRLSTTERYMVLAEIKEPGKKQALEEL